MHPGSLKHVHTRSKVLNFIQSCSILAQMHSCTLNHIQPCFNTHSMAFIHLAIHRKLDPIHVVNYPPSYAVIQYRNEMITKMIPLDVVVFDRMNTDWVTNLKSLTEQLSEQAADRSLLTFTSNKNCFQNLHLFTGCIISLRILIKLFFQTKQIFTER